jgi:hypothetical protein
MLNHIRLAVMPGELFDIQIGTQHREVGPARRAAGSILVNPFLIFRRLND